MTDRPPTSKPEMTTGRWFGLGLAGAVVVIFGAGLIVYAARPDTGPSPAACIEALDAAEHVIDAAADALGLVGQAFEAITVFNLERLEDIGSQLDDAADEARRLRDDYDAAAGECRDG